MKKEIEDYILECVDATNYEVAPRTPKEKLTFVLDTYHKEYSCSWLHRQWPTLDERLAQYFRGLPSCFNIEFVDYCQAERLKEWGMSTRDIFRGDYFLFVAREFLALAKREGIDLSAY